MVDVGSDGDSSSLAATGATLTAAALVPESSGIAMLAAGPGLSTLVQRGRRGP